ncbi:MAG: hypothetical protein ACOX8Q_00200 [Christensenellales bacterium]|jgi:hypothetical protein
MKKNVLLVLALCIVMLFCACEKPQTISIALGEFEYEQKIDSSLGDAVASEGNTFLVVYLTPVKGNDVTMDDAHHYFYSGTSAVIDNQTYDLYCLAYEKVDSQTVRYGLVFEIADNVYTDSNKPPVVSLVLPEV